MKTRTPANPRPWSNFGINKDNRTAFDKAWHVTHVEYAINIQKAGCIRPSLVGDRSILNKERILVNWFSPNHWTDGFRYGHVRYTFTMDILMRGKHIYWVQANHSSTPAVQFLLSDRKRQHPKLIPYNPEKEAGPFQRHAGQYYRNGNIVLELMVEDDVWLADCTDAGFVKHHPDMCGMPGRCGFMKQTRDQAAIRFLGHLLTGGAVDHMSLFLKSTGTGHGAGELAGGIDRILQWAEKLHFTGLAFGLSEEEKRILLLPFFTYFITYDRDCFQRCIALFAGKEEFERLFFSLLTERIGISDFSDLR